MKRFILLFVFLLLVASSAFAGVDVVIKTGNLTSCDARLKQLGFVVRDAEHETPFNKIEQKYEIVNTPIIEDVNGDLYFTIRLSDTQAANLPSNDTPNFSTPWRTGDDPADWPMIDVQAYDDNDQPSGTRQVGVFRIRGPLGMD